MKKTVRVNTSYLAEWMRDYYFSLLSEDFDFVEDPSNPEYVFVGTSQTNYTRGKDYISHRFLNDFPKSAIRIYLQHEAVGFDTTLFDYAVIFSDDLKLDDRVFFANFFSAGYFHTLGKDVFDRLDSPKEDPRILLSGKTAFCNFIYSHGGVPEREQLFRTLSRHRFVESHGKLLNNINPEEKLLAGRHYGRNWFEEGIDLKRNSKFSIAAENALHPKGYYLSEKIVSAMLANTIPIYWGNPEAGRMFNSAAFINCHDHSSFDDVLARVIEIDRDDDLWCGMMKEPWMTREQFLKASGNQAELKQFLTSILAQPMETARRRPRGFWAGRYENAKKGLLADARRSQERRRIVVPVLQAKFIERLDELLGVTQAESVISDLHSLRKRMTDEQWQEFLNPDSNPRARLMRLMIESTQSRRSKVKLAIAFYDGGRKWGVGSNRALGVRLLRELVEGGILDSANCPPKAYLYWGIVNMKGELPMVQQNPEVALECFRKVSDQAPERIRNLAIYHQALIQFQEKHIDQARQDFTILLLNDGVEPSQVPLLIDLLGHRVSLSNTQRNLAESAFDTGGIRNMKNWKKLRSADFPWKFRWNARAFTKSLEHRGYFAPQAK